MNTVPPYWISGAYIEAFSERKQLKTFLGKARFSQPSVETMTSADYTTMIVPTIVNVVNRKKLRMSFSTLYASTAIGIQGFITKLITPSFLVSMTLIANETPMNRPRKQSHTPFSSSRKEG